MIFGSFLVKFLVASQRSKACVFWEWNYFAESQCPPETQILHINVDESGIELFHGTAAGNIIVNKHVLPVPSEPTQRVDSSAQKFALTHVAFVCDDR